MTRLVPRQRRSFLAVLISMGLTAAAMTETPAETNAADLWFPVGEVLEYRVYWGIIPVGRSRIWSDWHEEDERRYIVLRMTTKSFSVVSRIYPVDDFVESIVDPDTFLTLRYRQQLNEGKHHRDELWFFDHANKIATRHDYRTGVTNTVEIGSDTRDILTFVYYLRKDGLQPGEENASRVVVEEKVYDLHIKSVKTQYLRMPMVGKVKTLKIEPAAKFGEIFVHKGRMWIWISDDERRVGLQMKINVPVASVRTVLTGVSGPGDDKWTRAGKRKRK